MTRAIAYMFALLPIVAAPQSLLAETRMDIRVDHASVVLQDFQHLPENAIPERLLREASAIAIVPSVLKLGMVVGARFGRGVIMTRTSTGAWQPPTFISVTSGSVGWQIGAQAQDLILIFTSNDALQRIRSAGLTLGADAAIAAGPLGRSTSAATDQRFTAPIYSYSRTKGLFAGIALDGAVIKPDYKSNAAYYQEPAVTIDNVGKVGRQQWPASAVSILSLLTARPTTESAAENSQQDAPAGETKNVTTFGIGESPVEP